jgi:hypothetical protein
MARCLGLSKAQEAEMHLLQPRQAVVKLSRGCMTAIPIEVRDYHGPEGLVQQDSYSTASGLLSRIRESIVPYVVKPQEGVEESKRQDMSRNDRVLLNSIWIDPYLLTTDRYKMLGNTMSVATAVKTKERLKLQGYIAEREVVGLKRGKGKLLTLTAKGEEWASRAFGAKSAHKKARGGIVHQFWIERVKTWYEAREAEVVVGDTRSGKEVDLGVIENGKRIAVEVSLQSKNVLANVTSDVESGCYDEVLVLVPGREDLAKLTAVLRKELPEGTVNRTRIELLQKYR